MTPLEELDLARAKEVSEYLGLAASKLPTIARAMRQMRKGDESRGLRVAQVKLLDKCGNNSMNCPHAPTMKAWLSASPYAPEEK